MEEQLRANDHKPGWHDCKPGDLHRHLEAEVKELHDAIVGVLFATSPGQRVARLLHLCREAADVGNLAMMVADVMDALPESPAQPLVYAATAVQAEALEQYQKRRPFASLHEGWGILDEEVEEYKDACRENNRKEAVLEAIQIGAVATRIAARFCDPYDHP
jgi:NTP pyrophosphatase (non-canonical NTP hydrolase)